MPPSGRPISPPRWPPTPAKAAFERLGKSGRYAVILPLLKARTAQTRARILARAVARLAAQN
jgi:hypothetical protein